MVETNVLKELLDRFMLMGNIKESELRISGNEIFFIRNFAYGKFSDIKKLIKLEDEIIAEVQKIKLQNGQKALLSKLKHYIIQKIIYLEMVLQWPSMKLIDDWVSRRNVLENLFFKISEQKVDKSIVKGTDLENIFNQTKKGYWLSKLICYYVSLLKKLSKVRFVKRELNYKLVSLLNLILSYELARSKNLSF